MGRDEENENRKRKLSKMATAAITLGVSTRLFFKNGGRELLTKGVHSLRSSLREASVELGGQSLRSVKGRGLEYIQDYVGYVREGIKEHWDDPIEINHFSNDSIFGIIKQKAILENNIDKKAQSIAREELFRTTLKQRIAEVVDLDSEFLDHRTNQIIDSLYTHPEDFIIPNSRPDNNALYSAHFNESFQDLIAHTYGEKSSSVQHNILEAMIEVDREYGNHKNTAQKRIEQAIEKLNDPKTYTHLKKNKDSFFDKLIDDVSNSRTATVNDVLNHRGDQFFKDLIVSVGDNESNLFNELERLVSKNKDFGELFVDRALRINKKGEFHYYNDLRELKRKTDDYVFNQTALKIFKPFVNLNKSFKQDSVIFIQKGTVDYQLQALAEGKYTGLLNQSYVRILDKTYQVTDAGLKHLKNLDDTSMISSEHSFESYQFKSLVGDVNYSIRPQNRLSKTLGLNDYPHASISDKIFSGDHFIGKLLSGITKRSNYEATASNLSLYTTLGLDDATDELYEYFSYAKKLNKELNKELRPISKSSIEQLKDIVKDERISNLLEISKDDHTILDWVNSIQKDEINSIQNSSLKNLVYQYKNNPNIIHRKYISTHYGENYAKRWPNRGNKYTNVDTYFSQIKKEIVKESLLVGGKNQSKEAILQTLKQSDFNLKDFNSLHLSLHTIYYEEALNLQKTKDFHIDLNRVLDSAHEAQNLFFGEGTFAEDFREVTQKISNKARDRKQYSEHVAQKIELETLKANPANRYIHLKNGVSLTPLDILKNSNDQIKVKAYFKQFVAGRKNLQDVTRTTLTPYFMLNRLTSELGHVGLDLSHQDKGSVLDLGKNIFLKRALPVYAGFYALSYLNYEAQNFTGTSLKGAAANSIANVSLGLKSVTDIFQNPLKDAYYWLTPLNYISEGPYKNKEELKEHYKNGYVPARKGKYWPTGSSEFFGGKIEYFQPNFVKRANTEWYDIGVYGSSKEKWKHSLIPTPRHPLSTIRYLLDPYWLEKKHEYDRPYPVSGPMFDPQTPWGVVGNMTIGRIIKPRKQMNKRFLTKNGIDIRGIIEQNNNWIREKARSKFNTITVIGADSAYETDNLLPNLVLSQGKGTFGFSTSGTGMIGTSAKDNGTGTLPTLFGKSTSEDKGKNYKKIDRNPQYVSLNLSERLNIIMNSGRIDREAILKEIDQINTSIKMRARLSYGHDSNFAKEMLNKNRLTVEDTLNDPDVQAELRNVTSTTELIADARYSVSQLEGIYGFLLSTAFPTNKKRVWANSSYMYASTRKFWQTNMEGLDKGGIMEIIRRFIPHEDRNRIRVNPLRNNMPTWLPSRFRTGDPYTLIKKGEMRLPGPAYEALYGDRKMINTTVGPSILAGTKEEILNYLITGNTTTDTEALETMNEGTKLHEKYEKIMLDSGIAIETEGELIDEKNGIKGKYDVLLRDSTAREGVAVMDIKTVGAKKFQDLKINGVNQKNQRQVNYYLGLMGLSKGYVHYINRDNPEEMITYDFQFSKGMYDETLNNLKEARKALDKMIRKNQISPYENYNDFEKFRILADVAPGSDEYKKYKALVEANLKDSQEKEYEDIIRRVREQNKDHRFFPYVFAKVKTAKIKGTIESVTQHGIKLIGSNKIYEVAGIEKMNDSVNNYLKPGLDVIVEINSLYEKNRKTNAIFYSNGMNINRQMMRDGVVNRIQTRDNAMDVRAGLTPLQITLGKPFELLAHLKLPLIHNKFMKVESAYESWLSENVYGSKFQTWEHPIQTILKPALQKDFGISPVQGLIGAGLFVANEIFRNDKRLSARSRYWLDKAFKMITPGAFTGFMTEGVLKLNWSDHKTKMGSRIGAVIGLGGAWYANSQNPFISVPTATAMGHYIGSWLKDGWGKQGAIVGATTSLLITGIKTDFNPKKMFSKWIPKDTKKRWEIEEYFDRLKYLKYKGLYEKAAALAYRKDHVNIKGILEKQEYRETHFGKHIKKLVTYKHRISSGVLKDTEEGNYYNEVIDQDMERLIYEQDEIPATPYVRAALAYKQAMESTVYALDEKSSYTQTLRALEPYERDYFLEFMKTTDPEERKKILKAVSPYKQKILTNAWGMKSKKTKSNWSYFQKYKLPSFLWDGWSNETDLDKIKIKTIENEGLQISDFGYYDSVRDDIDYKEAEAINFDQGTNIVAMQANLLTALNGIGLSSSEVTIEPSSQRGFQVVMNMGKIIDHKIKNAITALGEQIL